MQTFIEVSDLSKVFQSGKNMTVNALRNINLSVVENSCTLLQGASGSGKTTLLSILACLERPTTGQLFIQGKALSRANESLLASFRQQNIGIVFQNYYLLPQATALQNIAAPLLNSSFSRKTIQQHVQEAAEKANIAHKLQARTEELSGGEQQRVAIARALVRKPSLLLADEPTAHLDTANTQSLLSLFQNLLAEGKTIIITSHDPRIFSGALPIHQIITMADGGIQNRTIPSMLSV